MSKYQSHRDGLCVLPLVQSADGRAEHVLKHIGDIQLVEEHTQEVGRPLDRCRGPHQRPEEPRPDLTTPAARRNLLGCQIPLGSSGV